MMPLGLSSSSLYLSIHPFIEDLLHVKNPSSPPSFRSPQCMESKKANKYVK
jgi:hypothetical protein